VKVITCKGCGQQFPSKMFPSHARRCEPYLLERQKLIDKLTYEFLYHEYVIEEKSTFQIAHELGLCKNTAVKKKLKEYKIKERTAAETKKAKGYRKLCQETDMKRYGVPYHTMKESPIRENIDNGVKEKYGEQYSNVFQVPEVKEKIKDTIKKNYGEQYNHISQVPEIQEKVRDTIKEKYGDNYTNISQVPEIKEHIRNTNKEKYGVEHAMKNEEVKQKMMQTRKENNMFYSRTAEDFFNELCARLQLINATYLPKTKEFYLSLNSTTVYHYDFLEVTNKKIIEFNGNFWHANPKLYHKDWFNTVMNMTAQEIWDRDEQKIQLAKNCGYDILTVWESDVKTDREKELKKCIDFLKA